MTIDDFVDKAVKEAKASLLRARIDYELIEANLADLNKETEQGD